MAILKYQQPSGHTDSRPVLPVASKQTNSPLDLTVALQMY